LTFGEICAIKYCSNQFKRATFIPTAFVVIQLVEERKDYFW
jgi:hypothetical protein